MERLILMVVWRTAHFACGQQGVGVKPHMAYHCATQPPHIG